MPELGSTSCSQGGYGRQRRTQRRCWPLLDECLGAVAGAGAPAQLVSPSAFALLRDDLAASLRTHIWSVTGGAAEGLAPSALACSVAHSTVYAAGLEDDHGECTTAGGLRSLTTLGTAARRLWIGCTRVVPCAGEPDRQLACVLGKHAGKLQWVASIFQPKHDSGSSSASRSSGCPWAGQGCAR